MMSTGDIQEEAEAEGTYVMLENGTLISIGESDIVTMETIPVSPISDDPAMDIATYLPTITRKRTSSGQPNIPHLTNPYDENKFDAQHQNSTPVSVDPVSPQQQNSIPLGNKRLPQSHEIMSSSLNIDTPLPDQPVSQPQVNNLPTQPPQDLISMSLNRALSEPQAYPDPVPVVTTPSVPTPDQGQSNDLLSKAWSLSCDLTEHWNKQSDKITPSPKKTLDNKLEPEQKAGNKITADDIHRMSNIADAKLKSRKSMFEEMSNNMSRILKCDVKDISVSKERLNYIKDANENSTLKHATKEPTAEAATGKSISNIAKNLEPEPKLVPVKETPDIVSLVNYDSDDDSDLPQYDELVVETVKETEPEKETEPVKETEFKTDKPLKKVEATNVKEVEVKSPTQTKPETVKITSVVKSPSTVLKVNSDSDEEDLPHYEELVVETGQTPQKVEDTDKEEEYKTEKPPKKVEAGSTKKVEHKSPEISQRPLRKRKLPHKLCDDSIIKDSKETSVIIADHNKSLTPKQPKPEVSPKQLKQVTDSDSSHRIQPTRQTRQTQIKKRRKRALIGFPKKRTAIVPRPRYAPQPTTHSKLPGIKTLTLRDVGISLNPQGEVTLTMPDDIRKKLASGGSININFDVDCLDVDNCLKFKVTDDEEAIVAALRGTNTSPEVPMLIDSDPVSSPASEGADLIPDKHDKIKEKAFLAYLQKPFQVDSVPAVSSKKSHTDESFSGNKTSPATSSSTTLCSSVSQTVKDVTKNSIPEVKVPDKQEKTCVVSATSQTDLSLNEHTTIPATKCTKKTRNISTQVYNEGDDYIDKKLLRPANGFISLPRFSQVTGSSTAAIHKVLKNVKKGLSVDKMTKRPTWFCSLCNLTGDYGDLGPLYGPFDLYVPPKKSEYKLSEGVMNLFEKLNSTLRKSAVPDAITNEEDATTDLVREEVWLHENCICWSPGVYMLGLDVYGLEEIFKVARVTVCSKCGETGASLGCFKEGCSHRCHYLCALKSDCKLIEQTFTVLCPKHSHGVVDNHARTQPLLKVRNFLSQEEIEESEDLLNKMIPSNKKKQEQDEDEEEATVTITKTKIKHTAGGRDRPSYVWKHINWLGDQACRCKYCDKEFVLQRWMSGNIRKHLTRTHGIVNDDTDSGETKGSRKRTRLQQLSTEGNLKKRRRPIPLYKPENSGVFRCTECFKSYTLKSSLRKHAKRNAACFDAYEKRRELEKVSDKRGWSSLGEGPRAPVTKGGGTEDVPCRQRRIRTPPPAPEDSVNDNDTSQDDKPENRTLRNRELSWGEAEIRCPKCDFRSENKSYSRKHYRKNHCRVPCDDYDRVCFECVKVFSKMGLKWPKNLVGYVYPCQKGKRERE